MAIIVNNFKIIRPRFEKDQQTSLAWLAQAHAYVKNNAENFDLKTKSLEEWSTFMRKMVDRFCCPADKISKRSSEISDILHLNFKEMKIFNIAQSKNGAPLQEKMHLFGESTQRVFEELYENESNPPQDLIHVTCTGYASPSSAQLLISNKNWGDVCNVTHLYHMGCYASIPALRVAQGFLTQRNEALLFNQNKQRVDIVHTELCSLHFNPALHEPEQFVIQSLFADGFISYSVSHKNNYIPSLQENSFEIIALQEIIFPECHNAMTWTLSDFGFHMTISRNVPSTIAKNVEKFLEKMFSRAGLSFVEEKNKVTFAIHPGGPKIIEYVADALNLSEDKIQMSKEILYLYGNMSSATLPHIWEFISRAQMEKNSFVVSLAFGPGLTIAGSLMRII